jgi:zinc protease
MGTVRDQEGLTYGIGSKLTADTFRDGLWLTRATFAPSLLARGLDSTWREIKAWHDKGITAAELKKAKTSIMADEIYARDDAFTTMYRLGVWVTTGGDPARFDDWQEMLKDVTVQDVNRVAKVYLRPDASTLAVLAGDPKDLGGLKMTTDN